MSDADMWQKGTLRGIGSCLLYKRVMRLRVSNESLLLLEGEMSCRNNGCNGRSLTV